MNLLELDVDIRDSRAFEAIKLNMFTNYVWLMGWTVVVKHDDYSILQKKFGRKLSKIWIPNTNEYSDYASMIKSAFVEVSEREGIPQLVLLKHLLGDDNVLPTNT